MIYSAGLERALRVAHEAHSGQTRKGGVAVPYVLHPIHAALMGARLGADDETLQAIVLHDVVEDCEGWTLERLQEEFGARVREIVEQVTEDKSKSWEERKQAAIDHIAHLTPEGLLVKTVDTLHNLSSLVCDLEAADDPNEVWQHFTRGPEATVEVARKKVDALSPRVAPEAAAALERCVRSLEQSLVR